jgi:hypothetical protein
VVLNLLVRRNSGRLCTPPLGTSFIFGSPYHHITISRTERVNAVIADALRCCVDSRQADWPSLIPLDEFAINNSASALGRALSEFNVGKKRSLPKTFLIVA